ncbi:MAG: hypothetical protein Kow006_10940 [Gammaproteobacteria bacterium]
MRFLCDEMLKGFARWLRAAGHDTRVAPDGISDRELIALAREEARWLLTCDRKLLEHRNAQALVRLLDGSGVEEAARSLARCLPVDWLQAPFSRCMECNTELQPRNPPPKEQLPDTVVQRKLPVRHCTECGRWYWEGSHTARILHRLERWQAMQTGTDSGIL